MYWNEEKIIVFCFISAFFFIVFFFGKTIQSFFLERIGEIKARINVLSHIQLVFLNKYINSISVYLDFYNSFIFFCISYVYLNFLRSFCFLHYNICNLLEFINSKTFEYFLNNYVFNLYLSVLTNALFYNNKLYFTFIKIKSLQLLQATEIVKKGSSTVE